MPRWMRRIRGALGVGLAWAAAWFAAGMLLLLFVGPHAADVPFPLGFGLLGFLCGVTFSGLLGAVEGHRRFEQMSMLRFALWGGVGGILFAEVFSVVVGLGAGFVLVLGPIFGVAGAGSAMGTLALARAAEETPALGAGDESSPSER